MTIDSFFKSSDHDRHPDFRASKSCQDHTSPSVLCSNDVVASVTDYAWHQRSLACSQGSSNASSSCLAYLSLARSVTCVNSSYIRLSATSTSPPSQPAPSWRFRCYSAHAISCSFFSSLPQTHHSCCSLTAQSSMSCSVAHHHLGAYPTLWCLYQPLSIFPPISPFSTQGCYFKCFVYHYRVGAEYSIAYFVSDYWAWNTGIQQSRP